jgi:hypothetical protein
MRKFGASLTEFGVDISLIPELRVGGSQLSTMFENAPPSSSPDVRGDITSERSELCLSSFTEGEARGIDGLVYPDDP